MDGLTTNQLKPLVKLSAFTSCTQLVVLCAEKAEPVAADRAVGFAVPQQAGGLVCLVPLAAARVHGQLPAGTVGARMGGACTRAPSLCDLLGVL